jgi:DNA-binding protein H-NS
MQSLETHNESAMGKLDLEAMDFDELWLLHEELTKILSEKITVEKRELEKRLAQLNPQEQTGDVGPKVLPKYSNPSAPAETWSGRGKQPRWLVAALQSGHQLEEFRITDPGEPANKSRRTRPT